MVALNIRRWVLLAYARASHRKCTRQRDQVAFCTMPAATSPWSRALHTHAPHAVSRLQLRFAPFDVINGWRALHPHACARPRCANENGPDGPLTKLIQVGWLMGLEPTTTGITILDSTN